MYRVFYNKTITDDISRWDVSNVTTMEEMFSSSGFNQPIGNWNVGNVTTMKLMFNGSSFDQDISKWNVSNVTTMDNIFKGSNFNQDISNWDVSSLSGSGMNNIFHDASTFNKPLNNWNLSNLTDMHAVFLNALAFNKSLNNWNVSNVTNMSYMLYGAVEFNQPIGKWNVSNVTGMLYAFRNMDKFNQDISQWNVSNVTDFFQTFINSSKFNQDLSHWVLKSTVSRMTGFLSGTATDSANYTKILIAWAAQANPPTSIAFGPPSVPYYDIATDAYNYLTNTLNWTFSPTSSSIETPDLLFQYNEAKTRIYTINEAIITYTPVVISIYNTFSFSITPSLPTGLSINTTTGSITGTPTVLSSPIIYSVICSSYDSSSVFTNSKLKTLVFSVVE
jgi:surface protein